MHIVYTAQLAADFDLMPRVFSIVQHIRRSLSSPVLLLDLGGACSSDSSLCQWTENRAPYLILDAMGYHVARADGLTVSAILGLQPMVQVRLVDDSVVVQWQQRELTVNVGPKGQAPCVAWTTESGEHLFEAEPGRLTLAPVAGAVSHIQVSWPDLSVIEARRIPFDDAIRADPTIVAAVEFVKQEARSYARKKQRDIENDVE